MRFKKCFVQSVTFLIQFSLCCLWIEYIFLIVLIFSVFFYVCLNAKISDEIFILKKQILIIFTIIKKLYLNQQVYKFLNLARDTT
jgi:hypothetical protein